MKRVLLAWVGFCLCGMSMGESNDVCRWEALSSAVQSNILFQLSDRRRGERMAVFRNSLIEIYKNEPSSLPVSSEKLTHLGIMRVRRMKVFCDLYPLFEGQGVEKDKEALVYRATSGTNDLPTIWLPKEHTLLCILDHVNKPKKEFALGGIVGWDKQFCIDLTSLSEERLIEKYQLGTVFSNLVYCVRPGCLMVVDYPTPEDANLFVYEKTNGELDPHFARERWRIVNERSIARTFICNQRVLWLTKEEASELVALVGHQWYYGDDSKYREIRREYPWFQPVDVAHPKTQLGKDLKAAIASREKERTRQR